MRGNERSFNTIVVASSKQDVHSCAMEHRCCAALACALLTAWPAATLGQGTHDGAAVPVGIRELEYIDPHEGGRHLTLNVFYPAAIRERPAPAFVMPFFTKLNLYKDAEPAFGGSKHPLVMFSHGRGSNGLYYAWFAEFLAARGYIVAALNHYRANTYDSTIAYLANKLWQRPRDVGLSIRRARQTGQGRVRNGARNRAGLRHG